MWINSKPITFAWSKSRELLAYLVDRKGATITKKELAAVLWDDDDYSRNRQSHLQKVIVKMMKTLKEANAAHIVIRNRNYLSVDKTAFDCDYYRYLENDPSVSNKYLGEYMMEYSWAEKTLAKL